MRNKAGILVFLMSLAFVSGSFLSSAKAVDEKAKCTINHWVGFNARPSYIMPTHGFYNGWNELGKPLKAGGNLDFQYGFSMSGKNVYQGCGFGIHSFGSHELMGTPMSLYIFQGAPLFCLSDRLTVGYEWNFGLSAGWKNNGIVVVSPLNAYINVAALLTWNINDHWDMISGPEYTHFSNGDTRFPNGGANTINLRIGAKRYFARTEPGVKIERIFIDDASSLKSDNRMSYDLMFFGAWRADRSIAGGTLHIINESFPVAGLNFNPLYHFNDYLSAGASLDLIYDGSADLQVSVDEDGTLHYVSPDFMSQCAAGLSARAELKMPIFAVNIGIGYNLLHKGQDLDCLYGMFALKAFVTDMLYLNVGYRLSSVLYSHNLMFGLGIRL